MGTFPTTPTKILRLAMLFLVLIITCSYTANLVSFFVQPKIEYNGPLNMEELRQAKAYVTNGEFRTVVNQYVSESLLPPGCSVSDAYNATSTAGAWNTICLNSAACLNCLNSVYAAMDADKQNGISSAWVDLEDTVQVFSVWGDNCNNFEKVSDIDVAPININMVLSNTSSVSIFDVNAAIAHLLPQPSMKSLRVQYHGFGQTCGEETSDTTQLTVQHLGGVFAIFYAIAIIAALAAALECAVGVGTSNSVAAPSVKDQTLATKALSEVKLTPEELESGSNLTAQVELRPILEAMMARLENVADSQARMESLHSRAEETGTSSAFGARFCS